MLEQLWDLFEAKRLFNPHGNDRRYCEHLHLAQMVSILGPPPLDYLKRSEKTKMFWDDDGIGSAPIRPLWTSLTFS